MSATSSAALIAGAALATAANSDSLGTQVANDNEMIIDLFAGGGGASEGLKAATGRDPDIAVNHDPEAVALHAVNHPTTLHLCEDIRKVDIMELLARPEFAGRRVGILWASPDCKHHSKAAGGRPKDKNIRGLAWEVLRWSAAIKRATGHLPRLIALENVEEFQDWCPLHVYGPKAGQMQKHRKGETFNLWVGSLYSLGFARVDWRELIAADYGVPTTRKRLFLVALSELYDADWPEITHAPRRTKAVQADLFGSAPALQPYRAAADIIDWSIRIPSIFDRKAALKPKTQARIAKGIRRHVIEAPKPFIVPVTHTKSDRAPRSGEEPLGTITTAKGGELAVAAPTIMPVNHGGGEDRVYDPLDPTRTLTAAPRGEQALASAFLKPRYGEREGQEPRALDIQGPAPTPVPTGNGGDLVGVFLGRQFGTTVSGRDLAEPHPTTMTDGGGGKSQLVAAHLNRMANGSIGGAGEEPLKTAAGHSKDAVVTAFMAQHNGDRIGRAADEPLTTQTHRGTQQQLVAPIIDKYYGSGVAAETQDPLDTATAKARFGLASAFLEQANTGMVGHDMRSTMPTIVAGGNSGWGTTQRLIDVRLEQVEVTDGRRRRQVLEFLWEHFGAPTDEEWANPLATLRGRLRLGLVIVDGAVFQITDIGMRMLVPRELYRAQGFPDTYVIEVTFEGRPLTKTAQTRMAGNSVCPKMAEVIATAFMPPAMRQQMARAA